MFNRSSVAIAAAMFALLSAMPASAAPDSEVSDPDDMASPLDVQRLAYIDEGGGVGTLKITTYAKWSCSYLAPPGASVKWFFDGAADGDVDLIGNLRCRNGRLWLFLRGTDSGNTYEPVPANRPNRTTARITMSFDLSELAGDNLAVKVKVRDTTAEACSRTDPCTDRGPDAGWWDVY